MMVSGETGRAGHGLFLQRIMKQLLIHEK